MTRFVFPIVLFCILPACAGQAIHEPSAGARGMPGAEGTFEFKPDDWTPGVTTWWKDSDGVDPGTAGCHVGAAANGTPNGRMFGEACLPGGELVESNPDAGELHSHAHDVGYPDRFDCHAWCVDKGSSSGSCAAAPAPPCAASARCSCR